MKTFSCPTPAEQVDQAKRLKVEADSVATKVEQPVSSTVTISDALAKFFESEEKEILQTDAVKRIWDYIKLNQLEVDTIIYFFCFGYTHSMCLFSLLLVPFSFSTLRQVFNISKQYHHIPLHL